MSNIKLNTDCKRVGHLVSHYKKTLPGHYQKIPANQSMHTMPIIHIRLLTSLKQLANLGLENMTIKYFCCWLFPLRWCKNFMFTFVVGVGCLWYWWLKILHKHYHANWLYWRKENQKSIVIDSKWPLFLWLYEAPFIW